MSLGGLLAQFALLKEKMKKKPCKRCGLLYDPKKESKCPHCGDLDDRGLERLFEKLENEHQGHRRLGGWLIVAAMFVFFVMLLVTQS